MKKSNLLAEKWAERGVMEAPSGAFIKAIDRTKKIKIEYVECPLTGTLEEMEVEDEDNVCPVIREYEKYKT
jgi:hypothetical protein